LNGNEENMHISGKPCGLEKKSEHQQVSSIWLHQNVEEK